MWLSCHLALLLFAIMSQPSLPLVNIAIKFILLLSFSPTYKCILLTLIRVSFCHHSGLLEVSLSEAATCSPVILRMSSLNAIYCATFGAACIMFGTLWARLLINFPQTVTTFVETPWFSPMLLTLTMGVCNVTWTFKMGVKHPNAQKSLVDMKP